ncbi:MAG TPA: hypothetical protein VFP50_02790 [Anaeromyxobacteraceae bacterium]|nr:hypothetical protein [Anaeromyxobacteraceae bacterium]
MNRPTSASRRPLERGQITWVTLLLLLGLAAGGYLAVVWVPIYVVHYEVKQTVRDFMNQAVKNKNDEQLVGRLCLKLESLDTTKVTQPDGLIEKVPSVKVEPQDVTWERDTNASPPMLHVALQYTRTVVYPWLDRSEETVLVVDLSQDLEVPNWGPSR